MLAVGVVGRDAVGDEGFEFHRTRRRAQKGKFLSELSLAPQFFNLIYQGFLPIIVNWSSDGWVLPVVSANPDPKKVEKFLETKKMIYFFESAEGERIVSTMKFLTPDPTEFEADVKNANPVED